MQELIDHWNSVYAKETQENRDAAKEGDSKNIPLTLSHCSPMIRLNSILSESQYGGKKVFSGNLYDVFSETHFSPVPIFHQYGGYHGCIIMNGNKLKERFDIHPNTYDHKGKCIFFTDDGWKISNDKKSCVASHINEMEWNIDNPIKFDPINDVSAVILRHDFYADEDLERERGYFAMDMLAQNMDLERAQKFADKFHVVNYDKSKKEFSYIRRVFPEKLESIAYCPSVFANVLINNKIAKNLKGNKDCKIID